MADKKHSCSSWLKYNYYKYKGKLTHKKLVEMKTIGKFHDEKETSNNRKKRYVENGNGTDLTGSLWNLTMNLISSQNYDRKNSHSTHEQSFTKSGKSYFLTCLKTCQKLMKIVQMKLFLYSYFG